MKYCPKEKCNWVSSNEDKYCFNCGTKMLPFYECQFCSYSYNPIGDNGKFCTGCGEKIVNS